MSTQTDIFGREHEIAEPREVAPAGEQSQAFTDWGRATYWGRVEQPTITPARDCAACAAQERCSVWTVNSSDCPCES